MDRLFEFVGNHWWLVTLWFAFLVALFMDNSRRSGKTVSPSEATRLINGEDAVVLDIRDKQDFSKGHLVNAINIPYANLANRLSELESHKNRPVILVCKTGQTVGIAGKMLREKGFNVVRLNGGMMEWSNQNLPVVRG